MDETYQQLATLEAAEELIREALRRTESDADRETYSITLTGLVWARTDLWLASLQDS